MGRDLREYSIWKGMRKRCNNPRCKSFNNYGARGIKICERWNDYSSFLSDMGRCPIGMTLERIDNNGDYQPSNCRWATRKEQNNNKRNHRILEFEGRKQNLAQWATEVGVPASILSNRLRRGWDVKRVLTYPSLRSRSPNLVEFNNLKLTPIEWDRRLGFKNGRTFDRIFSKGWTASRALTQSVRPTPPPA